MKTIIVSINGKILNLEDSYRRILQQIVFSNSKFIEEIIIRLNYCTKLDNFEFFRFKNLKNLHIEGLHLLNISNQPFQYLYFLEELYLEAPLLMEFQENTLYNLINLRKLQLILNVTNLNKSTFIYNFNLQFLKIIANISNFGSYHIRNLNHIETLSIENKENMKTKLSNFNILNHNSLKSIKLYRTTCDFSQFHRDLTKLIIHSTLINYFKNLKFFTKLTHLELRECHSIINMNLICQTLKKLKTLILINNLLNFKGDIHLRKLKEIIHLDLSKCYIGHLDNYFLGAFKNCPVNYIILSNNNISSLGSNVLCYCSQLKTFDLSNNLLSFIHNNAFENLINLNELHLQNNFLNIIPNHLFSNLKALRSLNISNNYIEQITSQWFDIEIDYNLQIFNLSNNLITVIGNKSFAMFKNLLKLNLCRNFLTSIKLNYFQNLYNLIELNLSFNKIQIIETKDFENLKYLQILMLQNNKIININERAFANLIRLKVLNLEHNFIKKLDNNLLRTNQYLEILNLSSNLVKEIPLSFFSDMKNLEILHLRNNDRLINLNEEHFQNNSRLKILYIDQQFEENLQQLDVTLKID